MFDPNFAAYVVTQAQHVMTIAFLYAMPFAAVVGGYVVLCRRGESKNRAILDSNLDAGMDQPPSLHPLIDQARCIGCGACTRACPEGKILGLIDGKAHLIEPTACIGHGACKTACPVDAISLVFGTAKRGVDIPHVSPTFETNVPGIFIAGELGGMGLISNAIKQGRQAMQTIAGLDGLGRRDQYDVIIVGGGPAGFAASLAAKEQGLSYVILEQDSFGGTIAHYPKGKLIMTRPATLPIVGKMNFRKVRKEVVLDFWHNAARKCRLSIREGERVEQIIPNNGSFTVVTARGSSYPARAVMLAIGRRGSPRRLGVPGEELPKVVYRLSDPAQYRGQQVLVVGGGDSALEAAADLAEQNGTAVTLSYRGEAFQKAKQANRQRVDKAVRDGRINLLFGSNVRSIGPQSVEIEMDRRLGQLRNDAVIVCAGGMLPTPFLKRIGIEVETKYGMA